MTDISAVAGQLAEEVDVEVHTDRGFDSHLFVRPAVETYQRRRARDTPATRNTERQRNPVGPCDRNDLAVGIDGSLGTGVGVEATGFDVVA